MDISSQLLIAGALLVIGLCLLVLIELKVRTLRTRVIDEAGTLRFEAHTFSVEVLLSTQQVKVQASKGRLTRTPLNGGMNQTEEGPVDAILPALGLTIDVSSPKPPPLHKARLGKAKPHYAMVLHASDALTHGAKELPGGYSTVLEITELPAQVAQRFESFANRIHIWTDKLAQRLKQEQEAKAEKEKAAALAEQRAQKREESRAQASQAKAQASPEPKISPES